MTTKNEIVGCSIKELPEELVMDAARTAIAHNPVNAPAVELMANTIALTFDGDKARAIMEELSDPWRLAVMTAKYWGAKGVDLSVAFLDGGSTELQNRILSHLNAWGEYGNVRFRLAAPGSAQVRISRGSGGYWSYLGTDILHIPKNQPTMNLEGFSMQTSEQEYQRVVRHEAGHTLGYPHEHARKELVDRLDRAKTIAYFKRTQGWSEGTVMQQVLTPLSESSIRGTPNADQDSLMTYQLPGAITKDGQPIRGGSNITKADADFTALLYPKEVVNPPPPPVEPPVGGWDMLKKILDLFAAFKAKDWLKVITIIGEIINGINAGSITMEEVEHAEQAMQQAQASAPKGGKSKK